MRRMAEITAFLGLSAAVHAGVVAGLDDSIGGPQGQGIGGADRITLQAAPESLAALALRWTTAPEAVARPTALSDPVLADAPPVFRIRPAPSTPERPDALQSPAPDSAPIRSAPAPALSRPTTASAPDAPALPQFAAPDVVPSTPDTPPRRAAPQLAAPAAQADAPPDIATPPPPGSTTLATATSPRPPQRPIEPEPPRAAEVPRPSAPSTPQAARAATGEGGGVTQGAAPAQAQTPPALSPAHRQSLMSQWGAQILARIERARPRVSGSGQVALSLQVARNGQLAGVSVAQSSGNPALDQAALSAVRGAGRFPAAPDGLNEASYGFSLPVRFR